jgi:Iron-binding zinc finger CDGSH type
MSIRHRRGEAIGVTYDARRRIHVAECVRGLPATIVPTPYGPLYVRGRVELRSADGSVVVEETRLALCRCARSENEPFCDNSHFAAGSTTRA